MSISTDKNIEAKKNNTMFGVDLSDPYALAKFFLTQLTLRSGINCLQGQSHIPNQADSSLLQEVISILNNALHSCKDISSDMISKLSSTYDYGIKIVGNELKESQFFLNGDHILYESRIKQPVPVGPMLSWIQEKVKSQPEVPETAISKFLESIQTQKEENQSLCISR